MSKKFELPGLTEIHREILWKIYLMQVDRVREIKENVKRDDEIHAHLTHGLCFFLDDVLRGMMDKNMLTVRRLDDLTIWFNNLKPYNHPHNHPFHADANDNCRNGGWWFKGTIDGNIERLRFVKWLLDESPEI